jgi:pimeloyl-ACP methyl ester carboxylesterase
MDAIAAGKTREASSMLKIVAALRPTFEVTAELEDLPWPVTLAEGTAGPRLICVSTPTANGGVQQYAKLAAHFRGSRNVSALPLVGFASGEPLPATAEAAVRSIAESALRAADGHPFALVGHSSGGALAYAAAGVMERTWGITPASVVMLDTLSFQHGDGDGIDYPELMRINFSRPEQAPVRLTNSRLSAMGRWLALLRGLDAAPTSVPVLLVRCTKPLVEGQFTPGAEQDSAPVVETATVRLVDADHLSLAREDSAATAEIIEEWLRSDVSPELRGAHVPVLSVD